MKDPLQGQGGPVVFDVTEYENFIDLVSDYTLHTNFWKATACQVWYSISKEYS